MDEWLANAGTGIGLSFLALIGALLLGSDSEGIAPLAGVALVALALPLALVFLVAAGVQLGSKNR